MLFACDAFEHLTDYVRLLCVRFCFPEWHSFQYYFTSQANGDSFFLLLLFRFVLFHSLPLFCVCVLPMPSLCYPSRQQFNIFTNNKHKEQFATPEQFLAINITKDETYSIHSISFRSRMIQLKALCKHSPTHFSIENCLFAFAFVFLLQLYRYAAFYSFSQPFLVASFLSYRIVQCKQ